MDVGTAKQRFNELRSQPGLIDSTALDEVFDALEIVDCESILGRWKGQDFNNGHYLFQESQDVRWYGKTFNSLLDAQPMICYDENGELYSDAEVMGGQASLWMIEFRGKISATLVYDAKPVFDHFRKVDDDTLMGILNGKDVLDDGKHSYFLLERLKD